MKAFIYVTLLMLPLFSFSQTKIQGKVMSSKDQSPLSGVEIKLLKSNLSTTSKDDGTFTIYSNDVNESLNITHIGFKPYFIQLNQLKTDTLLNIYLIESISEIEEVNIVSTGYQELSKERTTGSFVKVDNLLFNRRSGTDFISRLDDNVPGMLFNKTGSRKINIRGQSTLFGNSEPLIVLDNFPYDGDLNNINPNDVESVTILKDAAAASIWGAKAANGVIVVTTKSGLKGKKTEIVFNSNYTLGHIPDLFYQPVMSTSDFIDVEMQLFNNNFYRSMENSLNKTPLTPVVELLIAKRDGLISTNDFNERILELKNNDVRKDYEKYIYQNSINQQYSLNINGGGASNKYYISVGYDNNLESLVKNQYSRFTTNGKNNFYLLEDKLEIGTSWNYTENSRKTNNQGISLLGITPGAVLPLYPYARLADESGIPLHTVRGYRSHITSNAHNLGLLDWRFSPLEEIYLANNNNKNVDLRLNASIKYSFNSNLIAQVLYQYGSGTGDQNYLYSQDTWFTRNEINRLSLVGKEGVIRPIPLGGILDSRYSTLSNQNIRAQLNYNKSIGYHTINAIGGYEIRNSNSKSSSNRLYGYNDLIGTSVPVNFISPFPTYINPLNNSYIPSNLDLSDLTDRYVSYYSNLSYNFKNRYTAYFSGRLDKSNLFGVNTNQKGVPLWSVGGAWLLNKEPFYDIEWLDMLKLRTSFGYNGSVDKRISAYTTARYYDGSSWLTKLPYSDIINPPNPELRWERVRILNFGLDFTAFKDRISGTLEYYNKAGIDLIGDTPFPQSSGISMFTGNYANTEGTGVEFQINSKNLDGGLKWYSTLNFSNVFDKVTHYFNRGTGANLISNPSAYPIIGRSQYSIYSYPNGGLDSKTGNPLGYLNGEISQQYAQIITAANQDNIVFHGSSRPTVFGSFRNTITWKNISVSANLSYRLGYFFRRPSVNFFQVLSGNGSHSDYALRWQKPGDELTTIVPSLPSARNTSRDNIYLFSYKLVERGDNIRLQDITVNYTLSNNRSKFLAFRDLELYFLMNNIGLIWKKTKYNIDPDYPLQDFVPVKTIAFGLKFSF